MSVAELIPLLQSLSDVEKRSLLEFLKAELEQTQIGPASSALIDPQQSQFGETLEDFRCQHQVSDLEIDVDTIFGNVREQSSIGYDSYYQSKVMAKLFIMIATRNNC